MRVSKKKIIFVTSAFLSVLGFLYYVINFDQAPGVKRLSSAQPSEIGSVDSGVTAGLGGQPQPVSVSVAEKYSSEPVARQVSIAVSEYDNSEETFSAGAAAAEFSGTDIDVSVPQGALGKKQKLTFKYLSDHDISIKTTDKKIIGAVKCGPDGTKFDKPIEITMRLYETFVPGTPVAVGLYQPATGNVLPQGIKTSVNIDGRSITFAVNHFSTYVAIMNLVSKGAPIGNGVEIPMPDLATGAFSHSYPITVVPARKSMQPAFALTYRSGAGNSILGMGFDINPGYIMRSTKNGRPAYDDTDTFYFLSDSGATELVFLAADSGVRVYQAKIESSFTKFYKNTDDTWRVIDKAGNQSFYGQSTYSKETGSGGTFKWHVTRSQDTNGNYMDYIYFKDQGKSYLEKVEYAGHINDSSAGPANRVEFIYESRDDQMSSYISGSKIVTAKRLAQITVSTDKVDSTQNPVWTYDLEYEYSAKTKRSLLKSVEQCGSDDVCLPKQEFGYQ